MTVPEIERLSTEKIISYIDYVKKNVDVMKTVEVREEADFVGFTRIKVEFIFLKRVEK